MSDIGGRDLGPLDPYAPPRLESQTMDVWPAGIAEEITRDEARAFVGETGGYYLRRWSKAIGTGGFSGGFNWAAFFFGPLWALQRKLYRELAVGVALTVIIRIGGNHLLSAAVRHDVRPVLNLAIAGIGALLANGLYLRRARITIRAARLEEPDRMRRLDLIARKGGISPRAVMLALGLLVAFLLVWGVAKGAP